MKRLVAVMALLVAVATPAVAQEITVGDIERADAVRAEVAAELAESVAAFDAAITREGELRQAIQDLAFALADKERELTSVREEARDIAREIYMSADSFGVLSLFDTESFTEIPVTASYLDLVSERGESVLARLEALEVSYARQQDELDKVLVDQEAVVAELEALSTGITARLENASAEYQSLKVAYARQEEEKRRAEEERRRREAEAAAAAAAAAASTTTTSQAPATTTTAAPGSSTTSTTAPPDTTTTTAPPPPPPSSGRVCPVDGPATWYDDWHAPRPGGRVHLGVDMLAARGTPLVAIESGTVTSIGSGSPLGGNTVWLTGASGDKWYYAHLDTHAPGLSTGQGVGAGQLLGTVGNTGNAQFTVPHLHFEYHPGGGAAAKPHGIINELCG